MTSLIVLPDIHDKSELLKRMARPLQEADAVALAGDMTNGSMSHLLRLLGILEEFNEQVYAVPGNMDTVQILAYLAREGYNLHRTHALLDGVALLGLGGALPFAGNFVFSEAQLGQFLEDALLGVAEDTPKIVIAHQPPYGTLCDKVSGVGHVGSHAVRAWIERVQPLAYFSGHIHEAQAIDYIGKTAIINPAPIWERNAYAFMVFEGAEVKTLEIRTIES